MKLWARIENGEVLCVEKRTGWVSADGWLPVEDATPNYDGLTNYIELNPESEWEVRGGKVITTYKISSRSADGIEAQYVRAIDRHINETAKSRRYDHGQSIATYVSSTNPLWSLEAAAFVSWRDSVWSCAHEKIDLILSGEIAPPSIDTLISELPTIEWPE